MSSTFTPEEIRIIGLAAPQVLKLLENREERILNKIYGEWQNGKIEHTAALAEWACVRSQMNEIKTVLSQHHKQEDKKHEPANR